MACALSVGAEGSDKFLVAYIVLNEGYSKNVNDLRSQLKFQLPFYMIPSQFIFLDKYVKKCSVTKKKTKIKPKSHFDRFTEFPS